MSLTPFAVRVTSADDLVLQLNLALAPLTSALISNLEIGQMRNEPPNAANLFAAFGSDTVGASPLAQPFQVISFSASTEEQVTILLKQYIAANPTYFFAGPYLLYRPTNADPNAGVIGVLVFNTVGTSAAANWAGSGGGGGGGGSKTPVALVDASVVAINAASSDNFTLLTTALVGATRQLDVPSGLTAGMRFYLEITQPAAGGPCALTYNAIYKFIGGSPPVLQTAPNAVDLIGFYYDGTSIYGSTTLDALNSITMTPGVTVPPTPIAGEFVLYPVNDNGFLRPIIKLPDATIMDLDADTVFLICNIGATTLNAGQAVYVSGVDPTSGKLAVSLAQANSAPTSRCIGVLIDTLTPGNVTPTFGRVMTIGTLRGQNNSITGNFWTAAGAHVAATAGTHFFLSDVVPGGLTQTQPTSPTSFNVQLGAVRTVSATIGIIEMRATTPIQILTGTIRGMINGAGAVPAPGAIGVVEVPYDCTIFASKTTADTPGNAVVDVRRILAANYPAASPGTVGAGTSIVASAPPTLATQQSVTDTTLTGWSLTLQRGDWLQFSLTSVGTLTWVQVSLDVVRS